MRASDERASRRAAAIAACALLCACAGAKHEPQAPRPPDSGPTAGASAEQPVVRCGPRDSYEFIAREYRCPDGKNPFRGDVEAAAKSRSGSLQNPRSGDMIDSYEVPCAGGSRTVYVDMYGCAEQRQILEQAQKPSPGVDQLMALFDAGDHERVMGRCASVVMKGEPFDEFMWCGFLQPASLVMMNMSDDAVRFMNKLCSAMPPSSPKSDARINQVTLTMATIARGSGKPRSITVDEANVLLSRFSEACEIDPREVVRRLETERV